MNYSNAPVPEDTNVTKENPFKQLFILGGILIGILVVSVFIIMKAAAWGAAHIPFKYEVMLAEQIGLAQIGEGAADKLDRDISEFERQRIQQAEAYLQKMVDAIAEAQGFQKICRSPHI